MPVCGCCLEYTDRLYKLVSKKMSRVKFSFCTECFLEFESTCNIEHYEVFESEEVFA